MEEDINTEIQKFILRQSERKSVINPKSETLLDLIKTTTQERAKLAQENTNLSEKVMKLESELRAERSGMRERFVEDKQINYNTLRERLEASKRECEEIRLVKTELELSLKKMCEQNEIKDAEVSALKLQSKEFLKEANGLREKMKGVSGNIAKIEELEKKLKIREKNFEVVSAELASFIKNKGRGSSKYGLIKNLENETLTTINAMDTSIELSKYKRKYKSVKRENKTKIEELERDRKKNLDLIFNLKNALEKAKFEVEKISEEKQSVINDLYVKMEGLLKTNNEYQNELGELKKKMAVDNTMEMSFRTCINENDYKKGPEEEPYFFGEKYAQPPEKDFFKKYSTNNFDEYQGMFKNGDRKYESGRFTDNGFTDKDILRDRLYADKDFGRDKLLIDKEFIDKEFGNVNNVKEENKFNIGTFDYVKNENKVKESNNIDERPSIFKVDEIWDKYFKKLNQKETSPKIEDKEVLYKDVSAEKLQNDIFKNELTSNKKDKGINAMQDLIYEDGEVWKTVPEIKERDIDDQKEEKKAEKLKAAFDDFIENNVEEDVKTVSTTTTFKDMLKKTNNLKTKFDELEGELKNIKTGNGNSPIKNKDDCYYVDIQDISNDEDFI